MKVLIVVADSVRADFLGCYDPRRSTPSIDALASEGVLFERCYASAPWTVPSIASMLTGVFAHRLGLVKWEQPFPAGVPTLFDHLAGTAVASFPFDEGHLFVSCPGASVVCSSQDTDRVRAWLRDHRDRGYVAFVHHWWTHAPYLQRRLPLRTWNLGCRGMLGLLAEPDPVVLAQNRRKVIGLYAHAIARFSEEWLPALLEAGRPDLLVLTADHGESWGERMPPGRHPKDVFDLHGNHLHDEVVRIPLILHGPQVVPATRVGGLVRAVDLLPTLLDLMGVEGGAGDGASLVPFEDVPDERTGHFCRNHDFVDLAELPSGPAEVFAELGCVRGDTKVLREVGASAARAYDLAADPGERAPRVPGDLGADALVEALDAAWARAAVGDHDAADTARMRRRLTALGYL